jgi:hypothetical protein
VNALQEALFKANLVTQEQYDKAAVEQRRKEQAQTAQQEWEGAKAEWRGREPMPLTSPNTDTQ